MAVLSPTVEVHWKWYYSFPTLPLWIVLLLITFLPKRNRQERIWPILITPLIAEAIYQLLSWNITAREAGSIDTIIYLFIGLAMAWSAVWILAPWLSRGSRFTTSVKQLVLILLLGIVALGGYYGVSLPKDLFSDTMSSERDNMLFMSGLVGAFGSLGLVGASFLVSLKRSPEKSFRPMLRMLWVLPMVAFGIMALFGITICLLNFGFTLKALAEYPSFLTVFWFPAVLVGGFMYLVNVPICLSSYRWPVVKERWLASFPMKRIKAKIPRRIFTKRFWKITAILFGLLLVSLPITFGVFYAVFTVEDHPQSWFLPGPKALADKDNAATYYRKAGQLLTNDLLAEEKYGKVRDFFYPNKEISLFTSFPEDLPTELLAPYEKILPEMMEQLRLGSECTASDWKIDFAHGPNLYSYTSMQPGVCNARNVTQLGLLQTLRLSKQQKFDEAISCWIDVMKLIRSKTNATLLSMLHGHLQDEKQGFIVAAHIASKLTSQQRARLLQAYESLPPRRTAKELQSLDEESNLNWAKNNPVALMQYLHEYETGRINPKASTTIFDRTLAGWQYSKIDWPQVELLMADEKKIKDLMDQMRQQNTTSQRLSGFSLTEKVASHLSGQWLADLYTQTEKPTNNAAPMLQAGFAILDGSKPDVVLKQDDFLPIGSKEPFVYESGKDGGFTLTSPTKPSLGPIAIELPPLSLRFEK